MYVISHNFCWVIFRNCDRHFMLERNFCSTNILDFIICHLFILLIPIILFQRVLCQNHFVQFSCMAMLVNWPPSTNFWRSFEIWTKCQTKFEGFPNGGMIWTMFLLLLAIKFWWWILVLTTWNDFVLLIFSLRYQCYILPLKHIAQAFLILWKMFTSMLETATLLEKQLKCL